MGNLCSTRPKSEDKPKTTAEPARTLTTEETQLINNITTINNFDEIIGLIILNYEDDHVFLAKLGILIFNNKFSDPTFISEFKREYTAKITNEVLSGRLDISKLSSSENIMIDLKGIIVPIMKDLILSKSTNNFTRDEAIYFNSLIQQVIEALDNYGDSNNRSSDFNITLANKCYALSKENPIKPMSDAVTNAVIHIVTTFNLTLNPSTTEPPTTTTESFKNKNSFIMKELEKQLKSISRASTESFTNKKMKRNEFTGYSLKYTSLLPKDYADF